MRKHCGWGAPGGFSEMQETPGDPHPSRFARHPPRKR